MYIFSQRNGLFCCKEGPLWTSDCARWYVPIHIYGEAHNWFYVCCASGVNRCKYNYECIQTFTNRPIRVRWTFGLNKSRSVKHLLCTQSFPVPFSLVLRFVTRLLLVTHNFVSSVLSVWSWPALPVFVLYYSDRTLEYSRYLLGSGSYRNSG